VPFRIRKLSVESGVTKTWPQVVLEASFSVDKINCFVMYTVFIDLCEQINDDDDDDGKWLQVFWQVFVVLFRRIIKILSAQ